MDTVLVILASFNGENYIKEQINSILNQTDIKIILNIYDDCSNDSTSRIIQDFNHPKINLYQNNSPSGSAANNFLNAIKMIDLEELTHISYIAFSDQDDIWLPNKINEAIKMLQTKKSELYMSNLILWEEKRNKKTIIDKSYTQKKFDYLFEGGSAGCTYVFSSKFAKNLQVALLNINYINWKFFSHDWFVYFFARLNFYKVVIDKDAYIIYRVHHTNVHGQLNLFSFFAIKERFNLVKNGWYFRHAEGYMNMLCKNSEEYKIYSMYTRNYFTRMYVIFRYNFSLIRSPIKAIQFFIVSLLPIQTKK